VRCGGLWCAHSVFTPLYRYRMHLIRLHRDDDDGEWPGNAVRAAGYTLQAVRDKRKRGFTRWKQDATAAYTGVSETS
jgi:hypothetical protein